jgi:hypothetical protein
MWITPSKEYVVTLDKPSMNPLNVEYILTIYKKTADGKNFTIVLRMPLKPHPK